MKNLFGQKNEKVSNEDVLTMAKALAIVNEENERKERSVEEAQKIVDDARIEQENIRTETEHLKEENGKLREENEAISAKNEEIRKEYATKEETLRVNAEAQKIIDERESMIAEAKNEAKRIRDEANAQAEAIVASAQEGKKQIEIEFEEKKETLRVNADAQAIIDQKEDILFEAEEMKADASATAKQILDDAQAEAGNIIETANAQAEKEIKKAKKTIEEAKEEANRIIEEGRKEATTSADEILESARTEAQKVIDRKETVAESIAKSTRKEANDDANRVRVAAEDYASRRRADADAEAIAIHEAAEAQAEKTKADAQVIIDARNALLEKREEKLHQEEVALAEEKAAMPERARSLAEEITAAQRKALDQRQQKLDIKEGELAEQERNLKWQRESLESEKKNFNQSLQDAVEQRYSTLQGELQAAKENEKRLSETNQILNDKLRRLTEQYRTLKGADVANLQMENSNLKNDLQMFSKCGVTAQNVRAVADAQKEVVRLCKKIETMEVQLTEAKNTAAMMAGSEEKLAVAEASSQTYQRMVEDLMRKLDERKSVSRSQMILPIQETPKFLTGPRPVRDPSKLLDETTWLQHILTQSKNSGIILSERFLYAYHTSLKIGEWSPMVVLAGVSGTGKSELPRQYARHGGMHFLSVPVKPDWDSPASLFGYFNSIENRFEATELLRALYQMQSERADDMLVVLLDEMNLAHPEQYFADLLSKFEEARNADTPAEYDIALGAGEAPEKLRIGRNVLWTGTMNEDETTKGLSDKVIDRSMLVTFPCPKKLYDRDNTPMQAPQLTLSYRQWNVWKNAALKRTDSQALAKQLESMKEIIQLINESMSSMGRNLGHRVWQSIENYILNYPTVISSRGKSEEVEKAFCDAIAFKMMPKFRGLETSNTVNEKHLNDISTLLPKALQEDFRTAREQASEVFRWNSAKFMEDEQH